MGAHNQRSKIRARVICHEGEMFWIEDLISLMESSASAPTYPILKRPDEKFVTEQAYNNAKFSEDIARDLQIALENQKEIKDWHLKVENQESIHPYDATVIQKSSNWAF
jgi:GTP cyclohydrolase I